MQQYDPTNPDGWIEHGNPNFATKQEEWINNCGPCSRSFADTYQGGTPIAVHGDSLLGEGDKMYDILKAQPEPTKRHCYRLASKIWSEYRNSDAIIRGSPESKQEGLDLGTE